ncbi:MAG: NADPH-dependent FMN reductase [Pikeienuella sp.]
MTVNLLGMSGSLRKASTNSALVRAAAEAMGEDVDFAFADLDLPLYNGDVEDAGYPESVETFVAQIRAADAIVISTPEYNKNISGVLKNALDWQSRFSPGPMAGKPVAILSATAGRSGGELTQFSLRHCLTPFGPRILQQPQLHVGSNFKDTVFANGELADEKAREKLGEIMGALRAII